MELLIGLTQISPMPVNRSGASRRRAFFLNVAAVNVAALLTVAVMQHGRLVEIGPTLEVCDRARDPYTQRLIAATPGLPLYNEL